MIHRRETGLQLDTLIAGVYFGYLGFMVGIGAVGELTGYRGLCQFAVKLALIFLSVIGVLGVVAVLLALVFVSARCVPFCAGRIRRLYAAAKNRDSLR